MRRFAPLLLGHFEFHAAPSAAELLLALNLLRDVNASGKRTLPENVPTGFVKPRWRSYVFPASGVDRHFYELCALAELRDRLRSGDIWVTGSRQYRDFETYLIPAPTFKVMQKEPLPLDVDTHLPSYMAEKIDRADKSIEKIARENEACRRLVAMPGVGPVTATAIIATIGNGAAFRKGRDFSAWLGVVLEEHSTGGKQTLWKIPKRGNQYLRRLFVQGARAVMQHRTKQSSGLGAWLAQLTAPTHQNVAIVALANKLARMAWAVLAKNEIYRPPILVSDTI